MDPIVVYSFGALGIGLVVGAIAGGIISAVLSVGNAVSHF